MTELSLLQAWYFSSRTKIANGVGQYWASLELEHSRSGVHVRSGRVKSIHAHPFVSTAARGGSW